MSLLKIVSGPCRHERQGKVHWTQDGWVSVCRDCEAWIYHGDNEYPSMPGEKANESHGCGCFTVLLLVVLSWLVISTIFHQAQEIWHLCQR